MSDTWICGANIAPWCDPDTERDQNSFSPGGPLSGRCPHDSERKHSASRGVSAAPSLGAGRPPRNPRTGQAHLKHPEDTMKAKRFVVPLDGRELLKHAIVFVDERLVGSVVRSSRAGNLKAFRRDQEIAPQTNGSCTASTALPPLPLHVKHRGERCTWCQCRGVGPAARSGGQDPQGRAARRPTHRTADVR